MIPVADRLEQWRREVDEEIEFAYGALSLEFKRILSGLTETQRRAILFVHVLGYTQAEAADRIGCSRDAVAKAIERSLEKMQKIFRH